MLREKKVSKREREGGRVSERKIHTHTHTHTHTLTHTHERTFRGRERRPKTLWTATARHDGA